MVKLSLLPLLAGVLGTSALSNPQAHELKTNLLPRASCENTATSRGCWGDYSIDDNWYTTIPDTGKTVEYWLSVEQAQCAPDGVQRTCMTFNGTVPGPTITADWGDQVVIHVTNNMKDNGTSIHWHGLRQLGNTEYDGVPGMSQCPIAPNDTLTYKFNATQYGSTWYHSHFSLQYAEGLLGSVIVNGPATANYDEDLGVLMLQDWHHTEIFTTWDRVKSGTAISLDTNLINGKNTWKDGGAKHQTVVQAGKKYRLRLINVAIDAMFQFSIDGHNLTVISADLVPLVPFQTDSVKIGIGQRYDVVFEASAESGDFWMRGGWITACASNQNADEMTAILRYDASSTATPATNSSVNLTAVTDCHDMDASLLVPHVELNVGDLSDMVIEDLSGVAGGSYFQWTLNGSSLVVNWTEPTLFQVQQESVQFSASGNTVSIDGSDSDWAVLVIVDQSGAGISHPIHLHGHDFWIMAQSTDSFNGTTDSFNFKNPIRRDVAVLPGGGYLAMAFRIDNPGIWTAHCHIAWHASEGFALQFIENQSQLLDGIEDWDSVGNKTCTNWKAFSSTMLYSQEDSGI